MVCSGVKALQWLSHAECVWGRGNTLQLASHVGAPGEEHNHHGIQ